MHKRRGRPKGSKTLNSEFILGRPKVASDMRRVKLTKFRLPRRWERWLLRQDVSGGRLIERALDDYYQVDWDKEAIR